MTKINRFVNKKERDRLNASNEAYHLEKRLREGLEPDEHMIYNVLCPQIRATWSKQEELKRRIFRRSSSRALGLRSFATHLVGQSVLFEDVST